MKNIQLYGPSIGPNLFVDDAVAKDIEAKFDKGENLEFVTADTGALLKVKGPSVWAMLISSTVDSAHTSKTNQK